MGDERPDHRTNDPAVDAVAEMSEPSHEVIWAADGSGAPEGLGFGAMWCGVTP